ncbi:Rap1a/Tai family immunity protein [Neptuniibacter pectenicola]|jgi:hypothetical protein|uniref:Rap1a/Tai family immunity protein n=1 Tax=Neptuniibacter pectenicola TaxID=1806669 RepID=A0ABU9TSY1_9GAMM|tara:strand:- start:1966 stop:2448 length:483 start_codon:yes stop_codon:yes gene_type:complete
MNTKNNKRLFSRVKVKFCLAIAISITSFSASAALLQMHEDELLNSCHLLHKDHASAEALACVTYISGFLDGALLTDKENANELKQAEKSGFMERALRTRLGDRGSDDSYLHFCVPSAKARADVIEQLAPYLSDRDDDATALKKSIYNGLKAEFPCPKTSK